MKCIKTAVHAGIIMSISTNEYTGKHASRRGNSILVVLILSIKNIFIVDAKVKELVYTGNTVFFLLPSIIIHTYLYFINKVMCVCDTMSVCVIK